MDKAQKTINELMNQINNLYNDKDKLEDKFNFKNQEKEQIYSQYKELKQRQKELDLEKNNINYKTLYLREWKKQVIIKISLMLLLCNIVLSCIGIIFTSGRVIAALAVLLNISSIPACILSTNFDHYMHNKRYLKKHKLEYIEKEILENNKNLDLNKEKLDVVEIEINEILSKKNELENKIEILEEKLKSTKNIRKDIITSYMQNNQELESLINEKYDEENKKQLIKKRKNN